jgi:alcohol dehydrogenase
MDKSRFELRKFVAPEFIVGEKARLLAGRYAKNLGSRHVLLVTDPGVNQAGWVEDVTGSLGDEGIQHTLFADVSPNPRDHEVMAGAELFVESGCDSIVVAGGGSPIDCAKGIGIVFSNNRNILDFEGVDNIPMPPPPLICIPTTAGTGADVSQFAIINDTTRKVKIAIISKKIVPDIALVDPEPLLSLSKELTAHTGMDALTHSVEAYVSNASSAVTDIHALESIQLMNTYLPLAVEHVKKLEWRYQTMLGSLFAGLAFSNASLGAVHAMAHSLGGISDLPHGECNALLLEHVMEFNYDVCPGRYESIGRALGVETEGLDRAQKKKHILQAVTRMRENLGITMTLGDLGVKKSDIPRLAATAVRDPCLATNPRKATIRDIEKIYEKAL